MKRISIEVTEQQSQRLKALAALQGMSIKDFVLFCTIDSYEGKALAELEELLRKRAAEVEAGMLSTRSVSDIFERRASGRKPRA
ncbi:MAG: antitoxin [Planctomycetes bacterium]|nr:antitoxin [Planctomycetota bacterium]